MADEADHHTHLVQFYGADEGILSANVCRFFQDGFRQGKSVLCIATPEHDKAFRSTLADQGAEPDKLIAAGRLVMADAARTLSRFMVNGGPDRALFNETIGNLTRGMTEQGLRAYGEMVGILWQAGQFTAAIRLEELWNEFLSSRRASLLCGYPINVFSEQFQAGSVEPILRTHTRVVPSGPDGDIKLAVDRALRDVAGQELPGKSAANEMPSGEHAILAVREQLPDRANEVLSVARQYYATERRFRALIENSADAIALLNERGEVVYASPLTTRTLGYEAAELQGQRLFSLVHPDDAPIAERAWNAALTSGRSPHTLEARMRRQDGEWRWVEGTLCNLAVDPDVGALVFNYRDVTVRKRSEIALRESERRVAARERYLTTLLDTMPECVKVLGPAGEVLQMNRAGLAMVEADSAVQVVGKCVYPLIDEPYREAFRSANESVFHGGSGSALEFSLTGLKGGTKFLETRIAPLADEQGRVIGALSTTRDITERRRLEEKLRESAKLESLGLLAGGVAHDFNNLLTGILGNASLLLDEAPRSSEMFETVEMIVQASERASQLTHQMLAYSGRGHFIMKPLNLASQVREILALIEASIPKHVTLMVNLEGKTTVEADAGQLQQLVMNLVINAAEAVPSEGVVSVETRLVRLEQPRTTITGDLPPGDYAILEVRDTGIGMDEATRKKIFDPFFTTKFTGRGLGLAAVSGIIRGHKAGIEVETELNQGTTFRVFFPVTTRAAPIDGAPSRTLLEGGARTVLVVDDEAVVRRTARLSLERMGFDVLAVADGRAAVEEFRRSHTGISLVLLDLTMPGMDGEQTLKLLKGIDASVPVLASSGFSAEEARRRFGAQIAGFVQKPYTARRLAEAVGGVVRKENVAS